MRKRRVQLPLVILIGLTAILLGDHLLSGIALDASGNAYVGGLS